VLENVRWEKFCQLYARDGNAAAAYRGAGYHPRTADSEYKAASRLLKNVEVRSRIQELTREAKEQALQSSIADIVEIRQVMTQIVRGEIDDAKSADRIRAGEFLAKLGGQQPEPPTVRVELSLEQKFNRLREIIRDDGGDD